MSEKKDLLTFNGLYLSKEVLEEKYDVKLTELEWKAFKTHAVNSWSDHQEELRLLIFRHIKIAMNEIGYKPALVEKDIKFRKTS